MRTYVSVSTKGEACLLIHPLTKQKAPWFETGTIMGVVCVRECVFMVKGKKKNNGCCC